MTTPSPTVVKEKSQIRAECDIVERRTGEKGLFCSFFVPRAGKSRKKKERRIDSKIDEHNFFLPT
jgi:hypothetical protein